MTSPKRFTLEDLQQIYQKHPFQLRTIMARLGRRPDSPERLTEIDLAVDDATEITDQNHIGGVQFVRDLAAAARIDRTSCVADVGCGLGGSARLLAYEIGCRVIGVEIEHQRFMEAVELTSQVGLNDRVSIIKGDAEAMEPVTGADVLWGQSAWLHFENRRRFLQRWCAALSQSGRVAMEDTVLGSAARNGGNSTRINELEQFWKGTFASIDSWVADIEASGYRVTLTSNETVRCHAYLTKLMHVSRLWPAGDLDDQERAGWELARNLFEDGFISYYRIVAQRVRVVPPGQTKD